HLRATFASFFVHLAIRPQPAPAAGGKGINTIKKIVQICALSCTREMHQKQAKSEETKKGSGRCITIMVAGSRHHVE
ncbi:TPA: hypothetical protein ACIAKG_004569, partial [Enterobacter roggenkampii]